MPPGSPYRASWREIQIRFGTNQTRQLLLEGLRLALLNLKNAGCQKFYLDGSFITDKEHPGDWDACWELTGVDLRLVDRVIVDADFFPDRMKQKYHGDLFVQAIRLPGGNFKNRFQKDRDGKKKGIIQIDIGSVT